LALDDSTFVTDKTNKEPIYFRNKVRLKLIPEIEENYNSNFKETLSQNIESYKSVADYLEIITEEKALKYIKTQSGYNYINLNGLKAEHDFIISSIIVKVLRKMSDDKQITSRAVKEILEIIKKENGALEFSKDIYVCVIYGKLFFINKIERKNFCYNAEKLETVYIKECNKKVILNLVEKKEKNSKSIFLDYDKIEGKNIIIRNRRNGDFFFPSGLNGKKKLKDFFIDKKIPFFLRDEVLIFLADDEIICVGNLRESEKYKVDCDTKRILKIDILSGDEYK